MHELLFNNTKAVPPIKDIPQEDEVCDEMKEELRLFKESSSTMTGDARTRGEAKIAKKYAARKIILAEEMKEKEEKMQGDDEDDDEESSDDEEEKDHRDEDSAAEEDDDEQ
jgi:hypothetical protein